MPPSPSPFSFPPPVLPEVDLDPTVGDAVPRRRRRWPAVVAVAGLAVVAGGVGGVVGATLADRDNGSSTPLIIANDDDARTERVGSLDVEAVADQVGPSVVTIASLQDGELVGSGSGVILTADGDIITNAHVVADADEVRVRLRASAAPGDNVRQPGSDLAAGTPLLAAGHVLTPADVATLLCAGVPIRAGSAT